MADEALKEFSKGRVAPLSASGGILNFEPEFPEYDPALGEPCGCFCIIGRSIPKKKTDGGIILSDESLTAEIFLNQIGKILAVGPAFYKTLSYHQIVPEEKKPKVGDIVIIRPYANNHRMDYSTPKDKKNEDERYRQRHYLFLTDNDILQVIKDPSCIPNIISYT